MTQYRKGLAMFHGFNLKAICLGCVAGLLSGVLLADGTFIKFWGEEVRLAIEELAHRKSAA